ncbi:MAG: sulfatase-like hydrolase/transferase [Planctomycetaceae bacterium]
MYRRLSCIGLFVVSIYTVFAASVASAQTDDPPASGSVRPNIVLVLADDLGINDLACYGRRDQRTPSLDALAAAGMRFTSAYTAQPICSPSRAALMTGKSPARLHLTNYLPGRPDAPSQKLLQPVIEGQLPLEEPTIAEWLKSEGYATGLFGKWHLGNAGFGPDKQGFDTVVSPPANSKPSEQEGGKSEYAITRAAIEFIRGQQDSPFFCYVAHNNPHIPLAARADLIKKNQDSFHPVYAAMIETLDATVGMLIQELEQLGIADNTLFVFTSDNGGLHVLEGANHPATHNTPYRAGKGYVYEGGLREPLIIRWPGHVPAGSSCDTPVVLTDLVPTFLEAAGINIAKTTGPLDGTSLLPLLSGGDLPPRTLFWHFPNYTNQGGRPAGAVRRGAWKMVQQYEDNRMELYDLASDPGETNDLASKQPQLANELAADLARWQTQVGAQMVHPNPDFDQAMHDRIYVEQDPSTLVASATSAEMAPAWAGWRQAMNQATKGRSPKITPATGDVRLLARDATVHAETMRYESASNKNVLGYWVNPKDWAEWTFEAPAAGKYEVEVQQGCGAGSGGSTVELRLGDQTIGFTVIETGHFQNMAQRTVGTFELSAGRHTLEVRPLTKPGAAVMDLRRVVLRPLP